MILARTLRTLTPAAAAVAVLAGSLAGGAPPARAASGPVTTTYAGTTAVIANPGRGLFHFTETHWRADGSGRAPLDAAQLAGWRRDEGVTLVYRVYYLEAFVTQDRLDPAFLASVATDLETARRAGVQLVVRFAYTDSSDADAPRHRVIGHIAQLAPVLNRYAPVVAALQAGFVGRWGEWYYSRSFASDPADPGWLTDADWRDRGAVLGALLADVDPSIPVQVRTPAIAQRLLPAQGARASRVGVHDDCFVASADDLGTFVGGDADRSWLADRSRRVLVGGETCAVSGARSAWPSAQADLARYHWSYLNADFQPDVLASWDAHLDEVRRRLGYRIRLDSATLPASAAPGASVRVRLTLTNDGWAAPVRRRPVQLVLRSGSRTVVRTLPLDVRSLAAGRTTTVTATVTAPSAAGSYALELALPDASPSLAADPAYAVRLADAGLWNATTGTNALRRTLRVAAG